MNSNRVARLAALTVGLMLPALVRADVVSITTTATPDSATPGVVTTFSDTATLAGGNGPLGPQGDLIFEFFAPDGTTVLTETLLISGDGAYTSAMFPYEPPFAGTYSWDVTYTGDANNSRVSAAREFVQVGSPATVPEPSAWALLGAVVAGLGLRRRFRTVA